MKVKMHAIAKDVIRDSDTGAFTLYSILDRIGGESFPFTIPSVVSMTIWNRDDGDDIDVEGLFEVERDDQVIMSKESVLSFRESPSCVSIMRISSFFIEKPGVYIFRSKFGNGVSEYELELIPRSDSDD